MGIATRSFCALILGGLCGCSKAPIGGYQITASQLVVQHGRDFDVCELGAGEPECRGDDSIKPNVFEYVYTDDAVVTLGFTAGAPEAPAVHDNFSYVWLIDRGSGTRTRLSSMPAWGSLRVTAGWVFWQDVRHDSNGRCYSDADDPDCAVDIYGFDRGRGEEVRITSRSTVLGRGSLLGDVAYSVTDTHLMFVDRGEAPRDCLEGGVLQAERSECDTDLYLVDLATLQERPFEASATHQNWPKLDGDRAVWLDTSNVVEGELGTLMSRGLAAEGPGQVVGPKLKLFSRYEHSGGWLVSQVDEVGEGSTIVATDLTTGEQRRLTAPGEVGRRPVMAGQRVVWRDPDYTQLTVYELDTDRRYVAYE